MQHFNVCILSCFSPMRRRIRISADTTSKTLKTKRVCVRARAIKPLYHYLCCVPLSRYYAIMPLSVLRAVAFVCAPLCVHAACHCVPRRMLYVPLCVLPGQLFKLGRFTGVLEVEATCSSKIQESS